MRLAGAANEWLRARPAWTRPAIVGAAILATLVALRVLLTLPAIGRNPRAVGLALIAVPLAAVAGAAGGLVYQFVGRPLRRVPVVGAYLAGIVTVAGYLLAIGALLALGGESPVGESAGERLVALVIMSVLFGTVLGRTWFRRRPPEE